MYGSTTYVDSLDLQEMDETLYKGGIERLFL